MGGEIKAGTTVVAVGVWADRFLDIARELYRTILDIDTFASVDNKVTFRKLKYERLLSYH